MTAPPACLLALALLASCAQVAWEPSGLRWHRQQFVNDGGPLLVLPPELLPHWSGSPPEDVMSGDYGRACAVENEVDRLTVGEHFAVVMGNWDTVHPRWLAAGDDAWLVVGWRASEDGSEAVLVHELQRGAATGWRPLGQQRFATQAVLFHAASPGTELRYPAPEELTGIGDAILAPFAPGSYEVSWTQLTLPDGAQCDLVRWRRVD